MAKPTIEQLALLDVYGLSNKAISSRLNCSTNTIRRIKSTEEYQTCLETIHEGVRQRFFDEYATVYDKLNEASIKAIDFLIEIAERGEKDSDRIKAIVEILDRAPEAPKKKVETSSRSNIINITAGAMQRMNKALKDTKNHGIIDLVNKSELKKISLKPKEPEVETEPEEDSVQIDQIIDVNEID